MHHTPNHFRFYFIRNAQAVKPTLHSVHDAALVFVDDTECLDAVMGKTLVPSATDTIYILRHEGVLHKVAREDSHGDLEEVPELAECFKIVNAQYFFLAA